MHESTCDSACSVAAMASSKWARLQNKLATDMSANGAEECVFELFLGVFLDS